MKILNTQAQIPEFVQAQERDRGIRGTATKTTRRGDDLLEMDVHSASNLAPFVQRHRGPDHEVLFADRYAAISACHHDFVRFRRRDGQRVVERDRLKNGAEIVKAVRAPTDDLQVQIDLGKRSERKGGGHSF